MLLIQYAAAVYINVNMNVFKGGIYEHVITYFTGLFLLFENLYIIYSISILNILIIFFKMSW